MILDYHGLVQALRRNKMPFWRIYDADGQCIARVVSERVERRKNPLTPAINQLREVLPTLDPGELYRCEAKDVGRSETMSWSFQHTPPQTAEVIRSRALDFVNTPTSTEMELRLAMLQQQHEHKLKLMEIEQRAQLPWKKLLDEIKPFLMQLMSTPQQPTPSITGAGNSDDFDRLEQAVGTIYQKIGPDCVRALEALAEKEAAELRSLLKFLK